MLSELLDVYEELPAGLEPKDLGACRQEIRTDNPGAGLLAFGWIPAAQLSTGSASSGPTACWSTAVPLALAGTCFFVAIMSLCLIIVSLLRMNSKWCCLAWCCGVHIFNLLSTSGTKWSWLAVGHHCIHSWAQELL